MSGLAKSLLATALTLPLVAFVAGVLSAPEEPAPDRGRPVIIGNVDDEGPEGQPVDRKRRDRDHDRPGAGDRDDAGDDDGTDDDRTDDDRTDDGGDPDDTHDRPGPVTVVTPPPRDLGGENDVVGDDEDDDGDDETDDDSGGDD